MQATITVSRSISGASGAKTTRLPQIDYWRGLCLLGIYIHHLPLSFGPAFSLGTVGFCDTVVVFVFLSGFISRIAFGSALQKKGWTGMTIKVLNRAGLLLAAHSIMVITAVVAILLYHRIWPGEMMLAFDQQNEAVILAAPFQEIGLAAIFRQHAWLCHVLPLYFLFVLLIPVFFALLNVSPWLLLFLSSALWAAVRLTITLSIGGPLHHTGFWLNPFAWQFVFVGGFIISDGVKQGRLGQLRRPFLFAGIIMLLLVALVKLRLFPQADWFLPILQTKVMADFSYVAYFALLALVMSSLVPTAERLTKWPAVAFISAVGRHSLPIWVGTSCLVYSAYFLRRILPANIWLENCAVAVAGFLPLWLYVRRAIQTETEHRKGSAAPLRGSVLIAAVRKSEARRRWKKAYQGIRLIILPGPGGRH